MGKHEGLQLKYWRQTNLYILQIKSFLCGQGYLSSTVIMASIYYLNFMPQTVCILLYCDVILTDHFLHRCLLVAWNGLSPMKGNHTVYLIAVSTFSFCSLRDQCNWTDLCGHLHTGKSVFCGVVLSVLLIWMFWLGGSLVQILLSKLSLSIISTVCHPFLWF